MPDLIQLAHKDGMNLHWGSGPYAVLIIAKITEERSKTDYDYNVINLIGLILYSKTKTVNNIYKDTKSYDAKDKNAVDPDIGYIQHPKYLNGFSN